MTTTTEHRHRGFLLSLLTLLTLVGTIGFGPAVDASASTRPAAETRVRAIAAPATDLVAASDLGSSTAVRVSDPDLRQQASATGVATNSIAGIETRFGLASQGADAASVAARAEIEGGARIWRIGTTGQSQAAEAQFWTTENPASPGFASRYGIPESNVANSDFIESAVLKPGTPFVTRPAPGVGSNLGGGVEVVVPEGGVTMCSFSIVGPKGC